jgi:hypothetical protein
MSDPEEYRIGRVSPEAGAEIFSRTGIGDPYRAGIPYPIFLALLHAYPSELGEDTRALAHRFGFLERDGDPASKDPDVREGLPLGMHLTTDPFTRVPFVMTNCSLCHVERVRWPGGERLVVGIGNKRVRAHAYDAALIEIALRSDFGVERLGALAAAAATEHAAMWPAQWRAALLRGTVDAMRDRARSRSAFALRVKDGPPGRVAPIESFALAIGLALGRPIETPPEVGWSKVPDLIGYAHRLTLSWDAATEGSLDVLVVEADFAIGVRPEWNWAHPKQGPSLSAFLRRLPRDLPFPGSIDRALAGEGKARFEAACSRCHGTYDEKGRAVGWVERVVPISTVGTDPARAQAVTAEFVRGANELSHGLVETRRTLGYVPPVLTSIWARAPYGHVGQWPSLSALATRPELRPRRWAADLEAPLDLVAVGLHARDARDAPSGGDFVYDGNAPSFSVLGHPFLADLGEEGARAVMEYLKTL